MGPTRALARRTFADARLRTAGFAALFAIYGLAQSAAYTKAYPTLADRRSLASTFGNSAALKLFYGTPHQLETAGGYVAWRVGGLAALAAAIFGLLAAVRAFRSEEESGRFEILAAGAITRRASYWARLLAIAATIAALWLAFLLGLVVTGLSSLDSAFLGLVVASVAAVYVGVGLVASQLMPSGGGALQLGGAVFGLDFLLRVVADLGGHPALHWLAPLGWAEEARAFTDPHPAVLLLPLATCVALVLVALAIDRGRDVGGALFAPRDTVDRPRTLLLGSATLLALRLQAPGLAVWLVVTAVYAVLLGTLANSVVSGLSGGLRQQLGKFRAGELTTAQGVLSFFFILFVLEIAFFCCSQAGAARGEEAQGRLETLFALRQGRIGWLGGRLAIAAAGAVSIALIAGLGSAVGVAASGADVSVARLIGAGLNCLPAGALFLGLSLLLVALLPRQGAGLAYALVVVAFVWYLVGALLKAPDWLLGVSPFDQIGFVPAMPFRGGPAAVMLLIGVAAATAALIRFRTRDLAGI